VLHHAYVSILTQQHFFDAGSLRPKAQRNTVDLLREDALVDRLKEQSARGAFNFVLLALGDDFEDVPRGVGDMSLLRFGDVVDKPVLANRYYEVVVGAGSARLRRVRGADARIALLDVEAPL
jgi:hypothetical protein